MIIKTGQVFDRDEDGNLYICESFLDEDTNESYSTKTLIEESDIRWQR